MDIKVTDQVGYNSQKWWHLDLRIVALQNQPFSFLCDFYINVLSPNSNVKMAQDATDTPLFYLFTITNADPIGQFHYRKDRHRICMSFSIVPVGFEQPLLHTLLKQNEPLSWLHTSSPPPPPLPRFIHLE